MADLSAKNRSRVKCLAQDIPNVKKFDRIRPKPHRNHRPSASFGGNVLPLLAHQISKLKPSALAAHSSHILSISPGQFFDRCRSSCCLRFHDEKRKNGSQLLRLAVALKIGQRTGLVCQNHLPSSTKTVRSPATNFKPGIPIAPSPNPASRNPHPTSTMALYRFGRSQNKLWVGS